MSTIITPSEEQINIVVNDEKISINVESGDVIVNVNEQIVEVSTVNGGYPLPTTVYSVFGRTGNIIATEGDYDLGELGDVTLVSTTNGDVLTYDGTKWVNKAVSGTGTVTSVDMSVPVGLQVSGNPISTVGTLAVNFAAGYSLPTTAKQTTWDTAYNDSIVSASVSGTTTKTLTLNQQDGGTITASWTDIDTNLVTSVNGYVGTVVLTTSDIAEGSRLYYTETRVSNNVDVAANTAARHSAVTIGTANGLSLASQVLSLALASASTTGALSSTDWSTFNNKQNQLNGSGFVKASGTTISYDNSTYLTSADVSGYVPYTGATANVDLGVFDLTADIVNANDIKALTSAGLDIYSNSGTHIALMGGGGGAGTTFYGGIVGTTGSFASNGGSDTFAINHSSGGGIALNITKGGSGEGLYINKTSGSGNAATIIGTLNATTLVKSGGTSSQFLKADGSVDSSTYYLASNPSAYIALTGLSATAPLSYNNTTGGFTISQAGVSGNGYLSSTDWNTFNDKQASGNYITALSGEATASGPGSAAVTLSTSAVTGKLLTGVNITGGSISATDSILVAFGKVQNQINGVLGGAIYQSVWNASTNSPTLTSGTGTKGYYYIVSVAGSTNLDGITDWKIGDWAIFNGTTWNKVDNSDAVSSVNGFTGAVSLTTANISEVTNLYYTEGRVSANTDVAANTAARHAAVTLGTANGLSLSTQQLSLGLASTSATGALSSTDWNTFNLKQAALSGTGFVKISGSTISYDNSTYLTGNQTITLSGDVSGSGTTAITTTIGALKVTNAMLAGSIDLTTKVTGLLPDGNISSAATWNAKQNALSGTGFVKISGTTISYDNSTYLTTSSAASTYLPLTAGSSKPLTGDLYISSSEPQIWLSKTGIDPGSWRILGSTGGDTRRFRIYDNVAELDRFNIFSTSGNVGIGVTSDNNFKLDIGGTTRISGVLTLNSTISNATYTYTLPSATGTLALTSQLNSGTVTSVAALTLGTTGTDLNSTVANSTTTPVITLNVPTASETNRGALSSADWTIFNGKQAALSGTGFVKISGSTISYDNSTYLTTSSAASTYLPLSGGTLTGALGGTSASFSSTVQATGFTATNAYSYFYGLRISGNDVGNTIYQATGALGISTGGDLITFNPSLTTILTLSAVNAAFTTSVTATQLIIKNSGVPAAQFYRDLDVAIVGDAGQGIEFGARNSSTFISGASIYGVLLSGGTTGSLVFQTLTAGSLTTKLTIASTGESIFTSTVTAKQNIIAAQNGDSNDYNYLIFNNTESGYGDWNIHKKNSNDLAFGYGTSGGSTYTDAFILTYGGTVTFSSDIFMGSTLKMAGNSTYNWMIQNHNDSNWGFGMYSSGTLYYPTVYFAGDATADRGFRVRNVSASSNVFLVDSNGKGTFTGSVYATSFFESSDSRLKILIQDNYQTKGIASITPKLYTKNGKVELGYYAQDFVGVLDSAVSKGSDDMLSLSYREVHTAKIYALEQEIKDLKAKSN